MRRRAFLALGVGSISLLATGPAAAQSRGTSRVALDIQGMRCERCVARIEDVVGRVSGVVSAEVDLEQTRAVVVYQSNRVTIARIIEVIEEAGFQARVRSS